MKRPTCIRSAPVLQVGEIRRSAAFYTEKLGFESAGLFGDPPAFCIVARGTVTIMLDAARKPGAAPLNQYWAAYIYVDNVDALHREFIGAGVDIPRGPEDMPYSCRDFDIRDPDGHLVAFGQDINLEPDGLGL